MTKHSLPRLERKHVLFRMHLALKMAVRYTNQHRLSTEQVLTLNLFLKMHDPRTFRLFELQVHSFAAAKNQLHYRN